MALDIVNQKFLTWVSKNKTTFLLVVLLAGNVYQYTDGKASKDQYEAQIKALTDKLEQVTTETLQYERMRSEKLEFLLSNFKTQDNVTTPKPHNGR